MNNHTKTRFLFLSLSLFFYLGSTSYLSAQTDFSGMWAFKSQESIFGKLYSNGAPKQISVVQNSSAVKIEKVMDSGNGTDVTITETVSLHGIPSETMTVSKRKKVIIISWSDDQRTFTETASIYSVADSSKMDFRATDTWSLGEEGKHLILVRKNENFTNGETWECKATYEKQ